MKIAQAATMTAPQTARRLALGVIASQVVFTLAWLVLGFLSPGFTMFGIEIKPYSPITTPVSGLGLGPTGPFMNAAFVLSGVLLLVGVIGVFQSIPELSARARRELIALFALSALGLVIDGFITIETFMPHMLGFILGAGAPVIGFLLAGLVFRNIPRWRGLSNWLLLGSPLTLVLIILTLATFDQAAVIAGRGVAGLTERLMIVELSVLYGALGWNAFRAPTPT